MKLRRLKQEIREMGERRIEVELATAAAQAKSAALDAVSSLDSPQLLSVRHFCPFPS